MSGLEKATLTKLGADRNDTEVGDPITVQFNPASLKLTLTNSTEGGQNTGRQQRQFTGNASTELAFDLVFDTADEDDGSGGARSVREKTAAVEQFVLAQGSGSGRQSPPRVKFHWGELVITGVIESIALDFDLFAADGTPLRAKMGVTIKEQDARYELLQAGPGSSTESGAPPPGGANAAGPGGAGGGADDPTTDRSAAAREGETAADFAARHGLDPAAWRGLAAGLEATLDLAAGLQIDFRASLGVSAGIGVSTGLEADLGLPLEASLGLGGGSATSAGAAAGAGPATPFAAGFALSAAGGVAAAVETVAIARASAAASATVRAFGATVTPATTPDPRASGFGLGVPLRPRAASAMISLGPYTRAGEAPVTRDPSVPAWVQLPAVAVAAAAVATRASGHRTGCGCGCGPGGGAR